MDDALSGLFTALAYIIIAIVAAIVITACIVGYGVFQGVRFAFCPAVDYRDHLP